MLIADQPAMINRLTWPIKAWPVLSAIIALGLLLRLPNLNESLWNDEIWSTHIMLGNLSVLYQVIIEDLHPPFYQAFMFVWIRLFGDSELSVRMPPLLCGMASIWLVYELAARVVEKKTALLASFLLAASPVHIWYSQEARSYSALLFFLLLSLVAYLKLKEPGASRIWLLVYGGALFSGALSHYFLGVYVLLLSIICLWERHWQSKRILLLNASILVCLAGWLIAKFVLTGIPAGGGYLRAFTFRELWRLFFNWFLFGGSWKESLYQREVLLAQLFFLALCIYGLALLWLRKGASKTDNSQCLALYLLALPVTLLAATLFEVKVYIERSMFVALPFFYIAIARGVTGLSEALASERFGSFGRGFAKTLGAVCLLIVIALNALTLKEYFARDEEWTVYKPNPDWRSAARYLESEINRSPEQLTIFAVVPPLELRYYNARFIDVWHGIIKGHDVLKGEDAQRYWGIYYVNPARIENVHHTLAKTGARTFYLIHNKYWSGGFPVVFRKLKADARVQRQAGQSFKGIEIHRFMLRAEGG